MNKTSLLKVSGLSVLVISLAACQSIPKAKTEPVVAYPQVAPEVPYQTYDNQTVSTPNQPSIASLRWQDFYSDAKLKQLIATGLANNKDINATILAIQQARAQYQITDIKDVPTIGSSGSIGRTGNFEGDAATKYNVGLAMSSYEFDFWGRIASLKEAALQDYLATGAAKDAAQITLISNIAQSYVNYSYNLAQLNLARETLKTRLASLDINQKRFRAGLDSELTTVQARSLVESSKVAIATAETNLRKNENALRYLLGAPVDKRLLPGPAISNITNRKIFSAGLPSDLLLYRPDIRQAEFNLKKAGANINAARAAFYPSIGLSANVGTASLSLKDLFKSGSFGWGITPTVSLPIFDGGARKTNYELSEIGQQQALNSYEKSIQTAFREVNDVFATRSTLDDQLAAYNGMLNASNKNYAIADARFKAGLDNYLGVLDAQRSVYSTRQSILNVKQQQLISQIQLYQALGGGANLDVALEPLTPTYENGSTKLVRLGERIQQAVQQTTQPTATVTTTETTVVQP